MQDILIGNIKLAKSVLLLINNYSSELEDIDKHDIEVNH